MSEEKKPKKQRKGTAAAPPTEHKEPWQAKYATPAEIQQMVSRRVLHGYRRYLVVRRSADEMRVMRQTRSGGGDGGDGEDGEDGS